MKIKGVEIPRVVFSSGAYNFFGPGKGIGHGWWYDDYLKWLLPWFSSSEKTGFIAKTTPLFYREGKRRRKSQLANSLNKKIMVPLRRDHLIFQRGVALFDFLFGFDAPVAAGAKFVIRAKIANKINYPLPLFFVKYNRFGHRW